MEKKAVGVRKGAWTKDEDVLLRRCIQKYGEGRWHLVPLRAGLNRCRKSCRLRWLNYLRPNIKRGLFTKDEVDLLIRLHKLLGIRWSLIAGRIPGRTANDVKNFWNTHVDKKSSPVAATAGTSFPNSPVSTINAMTAATAGAIFPHSPVSTTKINVIRPQPRTFSKNLQSPPHHHKTSILTKDIKNPKISQLMPDPFATQPRPEKKNPRFEPMHEEEDEHKRWWARLLEMAENGNGAPFLFSSEDHDQVSEVWSDERSGC